MAETLSPFLTNVGSFLTAAVGWIGSVLNTVMDNPALFVLVLAIPIAGVAIGYLSRLIRL